MTMQEIEKEMLKIRKENNANGGNWRTDLRYLSLVQKKKKLNKSTSMEEIFKAKLRDLINKNNVITSNRLTMKEMIYLAKQR